MRKLVAGGIAPADAADVARRTADARRQGSPLHTPTASRIVEPAKRAKNEAHKAAWLNAKKRAASVTDDLRPKLARQSVTARRDRRTAKCDSQKGSQDCAERPCRRFHKVADTNPQHKKKNAP